MYEGTKEGDVLEVDIDSGEIKNVTRGLAFKARPVPPFMQELVRAGGLLESIKKKGRIR